MLFQSGDGMLNPLSLSMKPLSISTDPLIISPDPQAISPDPLSFNMDPISRTRVLGKGTNEKKSPLRFSCFRMYIKNLTMDVLNGQILNCLLRILKI